jgi:hypothetical protein
MSHLQYCRNKRIRNFAITSPRLGTHPTLCLTGSLFTLLALLASLALWGWWLGPRAITHEVWGDLLRSRPERRDLREESERAIVCSTCRNTEQHHHKTRQTPPVCSWNRSDDGLRPSPPSVCPR